MLLFSVLDWFKWNFLFVCYFEHREIIKLILFKIHVNIEIYWENNLTNTKPYLRKGQPNKLSQSKCLLTFAKSVQHTAQHICIKHPASICIFARHCKNTFYAPSVFFWLLQARERAYIVAIKCPCRWLWVLTCWQILASSLRKFAIWEILPHLEGCCGQQSTISGLFWKALQT